MRKMVKAMAAVGLILCLLLASAMPVALGEENMEVSIGVSIAATGTAPTPPETYTVRMQADDSSFPMPAGSSGGVYDLKKTGPGSTSFPKITYDKMGVYTYTIRQLPGSHARALSYDNKVYKLTAMVTRNETTNELFLTAWLELENQTTKPDNCAFTNAYTTVTDPPGPPPGGPTPEPYTSVTVRKVWNDENNIHRTRPPRITAILYGNGVEIDRAEVTGPRWTYTFGNLPVYNSAGERIRYTAGEVAVEGYTGTVDITTITNTLIPRDPEEYIDIDGVKVWEDDDDMNGTRPNFITVRLLRDGEEIDSRTVTAASNWRFSFNNLPADDGYGNQYEYTIAEDAVAGYFTRIDGYTITNTVLTELDNYDTPLAGMTEEELEDLLDLFDYNTPLWGDLLKTGDDTPLYPFIFGGIGCLALIALAILMVANKRKKAGS